MQHISVSVGPSAQTVACMLSKLQQDSMQRIMDQQPNLKSISAWHDPLVYFDARREAD